MRYSIKLLSFAAIVFGCLFSVSQAAKLSPSSGVGGLPYQAPLQPLPHGVGANISNNIQQTDASGPPDSAHTIPSVGADEAETGVNESVSQVRTAKSGADNTSIRTRRIIVWVLITVSLTTVVIWLWFTTYRRASKR